MWLLTIILIGLSVSMDAFSLALIYGTIKSSNKKHLTLSLIVGFFHFIMPIIGVILGDNLLKLLHIEIHIILMVIFLFIGIDMIFSSMKKNNPPVILNLNGMILFSLAVSFDSLTIGTAIKAITYNYVLASIIFFIVSSITTYIGLKIGSKISNKLGNYAVFIGGILLIIIGLLIA